MRIQWLGHSCFKIYSENESLIIDPYGDGTVSGYDDLRDEANVVLVSHMHGDHNAVGTIHLIPLVKDEFEVERIESYHDDRQGSLRGPNLIHLIEANGYRVAHLGDLGCALTDEQIAKLQDLDALMIPVGGYYTIGPKQAVEIVKQLNPKVILPMHYHSDSFGYDVLGPVTAFTKYFDKVTFLATDTIELSDELDGEVIVLDYVRKH